jgi:hypothetical protein
MSSKFCEFCGATLDDGVKFCNNCGKSVSTTGNTPPPPPVIPPSQPAINNQYANTAAQSTVATATKPETTQYSTPVQNYTAPAQQSYYQAPQQNYYQKIQDTTPMSVGQYILTMIISAIPFVGFIMLLIWAFSSDTNVNKKNYARAILILAVIGIVLSIIFSTILVGIINTIIKSGGVNYGY